MKNASRQRPTARILGTIAALALGTAAVSAQAAQAASPRFSLCGSVLTQNGDGHWIMWNRGMAGLPDSYWAQGLSADALLTPRRLRSIDTLFADLGQPDTHPDRIFCGVAGGTGHARMSDGRLVAWGANPYGVLGVGSGTARIAPTVTQSFGTPVSEVVYGSYHVIALTEAGAVWGWGANGVGQVGNGATAESQVTPVQVIAGGVTAVAASGHHSLALMSDGTVRTWGFNGQGQLGLGDTVNRSSPQTIPSLSNVVAIAAGESFSVALKADGTVWTWGANGDGQLATGGSEASNVPVQVSALANITKIKTNRYTTGFALDTQGVVWGWGRNSQGNLAANQSSCTVQCPPTPVPGLPSNVVAIDATTYSAFASTADGRMFAWGNNGSGVLGQGRLNVTHAPIIYQTPALVHQGVAPSDFDRDYVSDVLFRDSQNGDVWSWRMKNASVDSSAAIANVSTDWQIVGMGDADGDGKDDIYWRNSVDGGNAIWLMDGRNLKGAMTLDSVGDASWTVSAVADMDGDGRADIVWRHATAGMWAVWLIGDQGVTSSQVYGGVPSEWEVRGIADFDGDAKGDIIWRSNVSGAVAIYRMNGTALSGATFLAGGLGEWDVAAVTDTDRDGRAEILFRSLDGTALAEVHLTADATAIDGGQTRTLSSPGSQWQFVTVGDYDGDTHTDILWKSVATGELVIWRLENLALPGASPAEQFGNVRFLGMPAANWRVVPR